MVPLIKRQLELNKNSVTITASSTFDGQVTNLLLFDPTKVWRSDANLDSYFIVNFKNIYAHINSYSLLFYPKDHYPLSWEIKGSNDGQNWFLLDKREEDLCAGFAYKGSSTTTICGRNITASHSFARTTKVKYVKVQQIGENSGSKYDSEYDSEWHKAFYLSGVEFYKNITYKNDKHILNIIILILNFIVS